MNSTSPFSRVLAGSKPEFTGAIDTQPDIKNCRMTVLNIGPIIQNLVFVLIFLKIDQISKLCDWQAEVNFILGNPDFYYCLKF